MPENDYSVQYSNIADKIAEYYDRMDVEVEIEVVHRSMNWFDATAKIQDKRLGTITAHYVVLIIDGRVVFQ